MADSSPSFVLPALGGLMRDGRDGLARAGIALTQEVFGLALDKLAGVGARVLQNIGGAARLGDRDLDEAYADLLKAPGVAAGTGLPADFLEHNLEQELALGQLEAAAGTAAVAISDGLRLERGALYGANGDNQARLTELCADPGVTAAEVLSLQTAFAETLRQEGMLLARGAETRRLTIEQDARLSQDLGRLDDSAEERLEIAGLLRAAADPSTPFPAAPARDPGNDRLPRQPGKARKGA